jgi:hypothetical protein
VDDDGGGGQVDAESGRLQAGDEDAALRIGAEPLHRSRPVGRRTAEARPARPDRFEVLLDPVEHPEVLAEDDHLQAAAERLAEDLGEEIPLPRRLAARGRARQEDEVRVVADLLQPV